MGQGRISKESKFEGMFPKTVQPHSSLYTALALRKDSQFGKFINHLMLPHLKIFSKDKEKKITLCGDHGNGSGMEVNIQAKDAANRMQIPSC